MTTFRLSLIWLILLLSMSCARPKPEVTVEHSATDARGESGGTRPFSSVKSGSPPSYLEGSNSAAVIVEDQGGAGQTVGAVEALLVASLKNSRIEVLERSILEKLKKDALVQAAIRNRNASSFREIGVKYQTDVIVYCTVSADAERGIGKYWISSAIASGYIASTKTADITTSGTSPTMGSPGFPTVVGETSLEAKDRAVRVSVASLLSKFGLPAEVESFPTDIRINLELQRKKPLPTSPTAVAFGDVSALVVSGQADGSLIATDVKGGENKLDSRPHSAAIKAVSFGSEDRFIASGGDDERLVITEVASGRQVAAWGVANKITTLSFAPDGKVVAAGTKDGRLVIVDARGSLPVQNISAHDKRVNFVSFTRDGRQVITASDDLTLRFWDPLKPQKPMRIIRQDIFRGEITKGALSNDGEFLALAVKEIDLDRLRNIRTDFHKVRLIRTQTGEEIHNFQAHSGNITALSFGPARRVVASGDEDGVIKIWDAERAREIYQLSLGGKTSIHALSFSRDGKWMASGAGNSLMLWRVE